MIEIIKCENCGYRFPDNPEKHKYRDKYCPKCLTVYKRGGMLWKLNLPFEAFRNWLAGVKKSHYERDLRGRAVHQLKNELRQEKEFREPFEKEVQNRISNLRIQDEREKMERKRIASKRGK
jgi:hypothetical protein